MKTFILGALGLGLLVSLAVAEEAWQKADSGISETDIRAIAASPTDKDVLFAGTDKGIYKTTDGAKNWKLLYPSNVAINYIAIGPKQPLYIYAATGEGLIYSTDGGTVWQTIFRGIGEGEIWSLNLTPSAPNNAEQIYLSREKKFKIKLQLKWEDAKGKEYKFVELAELTPSESIEGVSPQFWFESKGSYSSIDNPKEINEYWGMNFNFD